MSREYYITFDPYYDIQTYNSFITASKNNGVELEEYIRIRQPYYRYVKLKYKEDLPTFVNYDFCSLDDKKFLVSVIKPTYPNEALYLRRKAGQDNLVKKYVTPKPLLNLDKKKYLIFFKAKSQSYLMDLSKKIPKTKIYKLGKSKLLQYNIYYCFNPYIKNYIENEKILMEFGENANSGIVTKQSIPKGDGEIEYLLNYYVLIKEKIENKTLEAEYYIDGKYKPLKRNTFI